MARWRVPSERLRRVFRYSGLSLRREVTSFLRESRRSAEFGTGSVSKPLQGGVIEAALKFDDLLEAFQGVFVELAGGFES